MSKYGTNPLKRLKEVSSMVSSAGKKNGAGKSGSKQSNANSGGSKQSNTINGNTKKSSNKQDNKNRENNKQNNKQTNKKDNKHQENKKQDIKQQKVKQQNKKQQVVAATKASMKAGKAAAIAATAGAAAIAANQAPVSSKADAVKAPAKKATMKAAKKKDNPTKIDLTTEKGETIKIIPLGGLEQIGLNITAFEHGDSIIVVDCGIAFPTEEMLGIDCVIPDVTYLKDNIGKVKAFFITHGHEDHIGALPYVLKDINVPVYGTKLTLALIEHKLRENGLLDSAKLRTVKHGDCIKAGDFKVEFIKTNHSISDASALAIFTPAGTIFHTGDFKIDYTPIYGEPADLQRMAEIGNEGCLALMCDSTNAFKEGSTASEKTVGKRIDTIFAEHPDNRIIAASFASNVDRVQQFINVADKYGRKVVVEGRSMEQIIEVAGSLGYLKIPEGTLINIDQLKNYQPKDTVIITTGSQGESMAALSRMASGTHKKVVLGEGDVVVMSSKTIPGNEKAVAKVINDLYMKGAEVILHDTHVSGHACQEDLKLIYALLKPKYVIPVHGEYMHLVAQKELALTMGIPNKNICIMSSGDVLEIGENKFKAVGHVDAGPVMVEGLSIGDIGNVVLKDRQSLAQNGIIVVSMAVQAGTGELVGGPELITRGFVYEKENEDLIEELEQLVYDKVESLTSEGTEINKLINDTRDILKSHLWKTIKRTPVILVNVLQVNV